MDPIIDNLILKNTNNFKMKRKKQGLKNLEMI